MQIKSYTKNTGESFFYKINDEMELHQVDNELIALNKHSNKTYLFNAVSNYIFEMLGDHANIAAQDILGCLKRDFSNINNDSHVLKQIDSTIDLFIREGIIVLCRY